ncbi:flavin monoamine oxidase family protein [Tenacibaculum ovolyticum]|uniref:flavin monoamine oxidase family protein n=1 Tax=Tenacibaculum ovolyticum TaxID=104270 RepID=UPI0007ECB6ED|nr:FAD-dependent oxidoreductase [Tenacibaculum ovolyticum]
MKTDSILTTNTDVLIVGAGVSGLYTAYRLLQQDSKRKVVILDRLNRTGGRLDSDLVAIKDPYDNKKSIVKEEEGGMRFEDSMTELMSLFTALGLCKDAVYFPMTTNRYFFRGHSFTVAESEENNNAIWGELYDLEPAEQNQSPGAILGVIYQRILNVNGIENVPTKPTPEFWQTFRLDFKWAGIPLYKWQLGGLIRSMGYSEECLMMLTEVLGFRGPFQGLPNAGAAWQILEDFPENPQYFTLKRGFSSLIRKLEDEVTKLGGVIHTGINVNTVNGKKGAYKVNLSIAEKGNSAYVFEQDTKTSIMDAKQVILAIPSKAMSLLFAASPLMNLNKNSRTFWKDINSIQPMSLLKINLYFDRPWWADGSTGQPLVVAGPSFADLPINSIYPFYTVQTEPGAPDNGKPAALTIYCDFTNTIFWQGLQNVGEKFDSPLQKEHSKKPQTLFPASKKVVVEAIKQIKSLFNTHYVPEPVLTSYRSWDGENDFPHAYHQWGLNTNDREVISRMTKPLHNEDIFTCNETWSDMQGWVNGSLRSSEKMLKYNYGLGSITENHSACILVPPTE